jgi:signal transduction histidine kinase
MQPSVRRDALLLPALFLLNCFFFSAWLQLGEVPTKPWLLLVWLYGLACLAPLLWRDRAPRLVFATEWVLTLAAWPIMPLFTPVVGIPVSLYAVAVHRNRKASLLALLAALVPDVVCATVAFRVYFTQVDRLRSFVPNVILLVIITVGVWGMGRVSRAVQQHVQRLERERESVREAVSAERRRIARELHDIVSHAVTVIVLQAAGAARIADADLAKAIQALKNIETTGKQAMAELRRLGVLQASDTASRFLELQPQPGLSEMARLLNVLREAGMEVSVHVCGAPRALDPSVDLAAYRIVQEGLTNALKHAGKQCNPHVRLTWETDALLIEIENDANLVEEQRRCALSLGRGLAGLRERAHAAGGRLYTGRTRAGGYRLTATLPVAEPAQAKLLERW